MITCPEIVASNAISLPLASVSLSVIWASTLSSVRAALLNKRMASLKVIVILPAFATAVAPFTGLKATVGAIVSAAVNVALAGLIGLFDASSNDAPMPT